MRILAFETSCDETGLALLTGHQTADGPAFRVVASALLSQAALHAEFGGVYPNLAKREHEKNLPLLYREFANEPCDAVAVTAGPGLEPALWQGVEFAKRVAQERGVPLLPVNHMEGHLISSLAQPSGRDTYLLSGVALPVLALLISGGHTEFVLMQTWFDYTVVGQTLDDAVGECFDKVARMLGLPYPGGPEISKLAGRHRQSAQPTALLKLPRPMLQSGTCDMSFSGLKTAALYALRELGDLSTEQKAAFAAEFEQAVGDVFVAKTRMALMQTGAQTFVIGGGVAANAYLRERLEQLLTDEFPAIELRLPQLSLTGDNAVMIAEAALARALAGLDDAADPAAVRALGNLSIDKKVL